MTTEVTEVQNKIIELKITEDDAALVKKNLQETEAVINEAPVVSQTFTYDSLQWHMFLLTMIEGLTEMQFYVVCAWLVLSYFWMKQLIKIIPSCILKIFILKANVYYIVQIKFRFLSIEKKRVNFDVLVDIENMCRSDLKKKKKKRRYFGPIFLFGEFA